MRAVYLLVLSLALAALAGCAGSDGDDVDDGATPTPGGPSPTDTAEPTGTAPGPSGTAPGPTGTAAPPPTDAGAEITRFEADPDEGEAPLDVRFTLDAASEDPEATWRLAFGDGSEAGKGDVADLPAEVEHNYTIGGNFTALFEVQDNDGTINETLAIRVEASQSEPPETHFEYGPSGGCLTETHSVGGVVSCISYQLGPNDGNGIDGWWQPLDERYWGASLTSTMDSPTTSHDSDCFFLDDDHEVLDSGHNGGDECKMDAIPEGTAWMFIFPWVDPATGLTVDITLA